MTRARESAKIISGSFPGLKLLDEPLLMEGTPIRPDPPSSSRHTDSEVSLQNTSNRDRLFRNLNLQDRHHPRTDRGRLPEVLPPGSPEAGRHVHAGGLSRQRHSLSGVSSVADSAGSVAPDVAAACLADVDRDWAHR